MTPDKWQLTHDTWHLTHDVWWGVNILSKFQLSSSYDLGVMIFWRFGDKGWITAWMNEWIRDGGVSRTVPGTSAIMQLPPRTLPPSFCRTVKQITISIIFHLPPGSALLLRWGLRYFSAGIFLVDFSRKWGCLSSEYEFSSKIPWK